MGAPWAAAPGTPRPPPRHRAAPPAHCLQQPEGGRQWASNGVSGGGSGSDSSMLQRQGPGSAE